MSASAALVSGSRAPRTHVAYGVDVNTVWLLDYTPSTSYGSGGDAIDLVALLPYQVKSIVLVKVITTGSSAGLAGAYDVTNKKVRLWNGTSEASGDNSAKKFILEVWTH